MAAAHHLSCTPSEAALLCSSCGPPESGLHRCQERWPARHSSTQISQHLLQFLLLHKHPQACNQTTVHETIMRGQSLLRELHSILCQLFSYRYLLAECHNSNQWRTNPEGSHHNCCCCCHCCQRITDECPTTFCYRCSKHLFIRIALLWVSS
jgi:hypothetical protein